MYVNTIGHCVLVMRDNDDCHVAETLAPPYYSAGQQAKEGSPFLRGDPQYTGRMGTPGTPFYRENGDPGSPFSRDPQNFMTPAL